MKKWMRQTQGNPPKLWFSKIEKLGMRYLKLQEGKAHAFEINVMKKSITWVYKMNSNYMSATKRDAIRDACTHA